ncbi:MAG: hypothetical protein ACLPKB_10765 [Xanthobacteraceae bacterium]
MATEPVEFIPAVLQPPVAAAKSATTATEATQRAGRVEDKRMGVNALPRPAADAVGWGKAIER